ncbi:MAG: DUF2478 domain-containing protein [Novosphingobium sp.]
MTSCPIAVVQGAGSPVIQRLLADMLTVPWRPARIAGVVEVPQGDGSEACGSDTLLNIVDGSRYPIFQDLGSGSSACSLDPRGVVDACAAVCRDIAAGCDLVVLSKFGKLEAESGSGLLAAFAAALEAGVPILTAVSPRNSERWHAFAAPYYQVIAPSLSEIAAWWAAQSPAAASSASR